MSTKQQLKLYEEVSENHAFFVGEALKAWTEMVALLTDMSAGSSERFNQAKERCEIARNRARQEYARLPI